MSEMEKKKGENVLDFAENFVWIDFVKLSVLPKKILVIGGQYVNKQSQDLRYY